ncbi:MAG: hypothetical protein BWZ10_03043 [candidate division BRC1 bacterium ADurb.BinA364]|nr:MAG: hypothetical protein BWZ10_03043 [candidate division BRC1 bacterium ADurb.BinA364]
MAEWLERTLGSPALLELFTRDVDARWGRMYSEKPRFDSPGQAPAHDDPYTLDSMRETLRALQEAIGERRA